MATYNARIHEEDGSYWAEVEELPGCFASGGTLDELQEALIEAIALYLFDTQDLAARLTSGAKGGKPRGHGHVDRLRVAVPA